MKRFTLFLSLMIAMVTTTMAQSSLLINDALGTLENNQYSWKSDKMTKAEGATKLRVTFLQTSNNEKPAGFPCVAIAEFYLYDKDGNAVALTEANFSSNATQSDEGNMSSICDGFTTQQDGQGAYDWYWHSQWSGTPNPYGYHYLEIDLTDVTADLSEYSIGWVTRRQQASPAEVVISTGATTNEAAENANSAMMPKVSTDIVYLYSIKSVRSKKYLTYSEENAKPIQNSAVSNESYWYFTEGTDGKVVMCNAVSGKVLGTNFEMSTEGEWMLLPAKYRPGFVISKSNYADGCVDDQSGSIGNWSHSAGDNEGTTWLIEEVTNAPMDVAMLSLQGKGIASIGSPVTEVVVDQWYILNNVGRNGYVSQEGNNWKMRAKTNIAEGQIVEVKAGYLFKITKNGDYYNIVSGNGKYFQLGNNTASTSATAVNFEIGLIGESADNFYIFDKDHGYAADGQDLGYNFVGWSTSHPANAGGNDSYKLLPVEFYEGVVEEGYYYIKGTGNGNNAAWYMSYNGDKWTAVDAGEGVKQIWKIEINGAAHTLMSCNVGKYANLENAASNGGTASTLVDQATEFRFIKKENDKYIIKNAGNNVVRTENGGAINFWSGEAGETWQLVPVTEVEVPVNEFASIYLPFAVSVEGATAYAVEETNSTHAIFAEKADIPAYQGAILEGNGTATLTIIDEATTDWTNNMLKGSTVDAYLAGPAYVLSKPADSEIGFYKAALNKNEAGEEGTTHFKNNANKAYLVVPGASEVASYSFRFGEGTTGVEKVEIRNEKSEIYDLTGRRVETITEPGIYIVNGKKVLVK